MNLVYHITAYAQNFGAPMALGYHPLLQTFCPQAEPAKASPLRQIQSVSPAAHPLLHAQSVSRLHYPAPHYQTAAMQTDQPIPNHATHTPTP